MIPLLLLASLQDHDHGHGDAPKAPAAPALEIRVHLSDANRKPADLSGATGTLEVSSFGAPAERVAMERAAGRKGSHAGESREVVGIGFVEFEIVAPCGCCKDDAGAEATFFRAEVPRKVYHCGTPGHPAGREAGTCRTCNATAVERFHFFTARLTVEIDGVRRVLDGFEHPAPPRSFGEGASLVESLLAEAQAGLDAGTFDRLREPAARIARLAEKLPQMVAGDELPAVLKACLEIVGLARNLDEAARAGDKPAAGRALAEIRARLPKLRVSSRPVKEGEGGGHSHK